MRGRARIGGIAALFAALALGPGGAPAGAAPTTPPTLQIEVIGQGTVTGTGIHCGRGSLSCYSAYGSSTAVTLTEAPASGWTFSGWEDGAAACAAATTCPVAPGTNVTATAVFSTTGAVQTSTLDVSSTNGDIANGSASYPVDCDSSSTPPAGTACSLTAYTGSTLTMTETPDSGYLFSGWGGACTGTAPSCAVYLQSTQSVGASFAATTSNALSVTVVGNGSVGGGGISCGAGATCSAPEPSTATVTLTASPQSGWVLSGWSGACTGQQSSCTVQMTAAASVTATFVQQTTLQVTVTGAGYVQGGGIGCDGGQTCSAGEIPGNTITLTAHPSSGSSVLWSGCTSSAGLLCTVTVATTGVQSVTATLGSGTTPPVASNSLTVSVTGDGYVTAFAGTAPIYCTAAGGSGCTASVPAGTTVTLTAVPASGLAGNFTAWTGDCITFATTSCTLTMNGAKSAGATFAGGNTTYLLSAQIAGSGSIAGAGLNCTHTGGSGCSAQQAAGATVTLTAVPTFGGSFSGWSGACTGTTATCSVTMTLAKSVTATFTGSSPGGNQSLAIAVTGAGSVDASGGTCASSAGKTKLCTQSYATGKDVTLTAKAAAGYAFAGWKGACTGARKACSVTVSSFTQVTATFSRPVLAPTRKPKVAKTATGHRITLFFAVRQRGTLTLVGKLGRTTVVSTSSKPVPGSRRLVVTVAKPGRYVFTLTLVASGRHSIRWAVKL